MEHLLDGSGLPRGACPPRLHPQTRALPGVALRAWTSYDTRMPQQTTLRIELTDSAKQKLATLSDHHGMTQVAMMSRLVEFFASRDTKVQSAIVGHYPKSMEKEIARLVLASLG